MWHLHRIQVQLRTKTQRVLSLVQVGSYMEFRCKPHQSSADSDHRPWSREGGTLCKHADMFYLFGGTVVRDGQKTNDVFRLSTNAMEWRLQPTQGPKPAARSGHCAIIDPESERMVIFGGRSQVRAALCRVWRCCISAREKLNNGNCSTAAACLASQYLLSHCRKICNRVHRQCGCSAAHSPDRPADTLQHNPSSFAR